MSYQQRTSCTKHHVCKVVGQWYQCATKAKNESIQKYYSDKVRNVTEKDVDLWKDIVYDIEVDRSMKTVHIVHGDMTAEQRAKAVKSRARDQDGPVGGTPNSAERRPKGRRHQKMQDENQNGVAPAPFENPEQDEDMQGIMDNSDEDQDDLDSLEPYDL